MSEPPHATSAFAIYAQKRKNNGTNASNSKKAKKRQQQGKRAIKVQDQAYQAFIRRLNTDEGSKKRKRTKSNNKGNGNSQKIQKITPAQWKAQKQQQQQQNRQTQQRIVQPANQMYDTAVKCNINVLEVKHASPKKQLAAKSQNQANIAGPMPTVEPAIDCQISNGYENENPLTSSRSMFQWMIHPLSVDDFFQENWEKTPVHIKRSRPAYYKFLMSTQLMDKVLRESYIQFSKNIDITSYTNGVRETLNPLGRALPTVVWDYYLNGCSVRMLNPQTYIPKLHVLNATLQEFFGCFVGANSYLTPPGSQGFAPHYDDIEAFILQIEGKKRWRLYKPRNPDEYLARFPSKNFDQSEIGEPIFDAVIEAGDVLYFPRGTIHQGETLEDSHSLHVTLSVYQKNCWGDFLEKLLPEALRTAIDTDVELREGLPLDYLRHTGYVHAENQSAKREAFKEKVKHLFSRILKHIDVDKAADEMAKGHIHDFLPPVPSDVEKECSVLVDGEEMTVNGLVVNRVEVDPDTKIRLLRSHCLRLTEERGIHKIYYSTENSKEYHEYDLQFVEIGQECVPALKELILQYPKFIRVEDLPVVGDDDKIQIAKDLWEKCIVVTDNPLNVLD